ncbi:hypothetical protein [Maricaulis sp.]|uniref:hypothetical protein n=1 Tax=Maricaulis sp. TaxID=1486257 RepID=UPI0025BE76A0|nr:hypothetical protein [Maricaulis sp.]
MILARISRAIREQNWLAVAIEFVIVVAGVMLAFQFTAWNEQSQNAVRVEQALARLQLETEENIGALRQRIDANARRGADQQVMIAVAMRGHLEDGEAEAFERGVAQLMYFSRHPVRRSIYQALEQSGDLALIADRDLVIALNRYQASLAWIDNQHASFRRGLTTFTDTLAEFSFHEPTDDPTITRVRVDLERLAAEPRRTSALVQMARMHAIFGYYVIQLEAETVELCHRLADATGRPCAEERTP